MSFYSIFAILKRVCDMIKTVSFSLFFKGNKDVILRITEGKFGHDTFLLDVAGMGVHMKVSDPFQPSVG